jgi:hypothetical protein
MHSQIETRRYYCTEAWHEPSDKDDVWAGLKRFIMVKKECESLITAEKSEETRYYITSLKDINLIADGIRGHWQILSEAFCYPKLLPGRLEIPNGILMKDSDNSNPILSCA